MDSGNQTPITGQGEYSGDGRDRGSLAQLEAELAARDARIGVLESRLSQAGTDARIRQNELDTIRQSALWRILEQLWRWQVRLFPYGTRRRSIYRATITRMGRLVFGGRPVSLTPEVPYGVWIRRNEPTAAELKKMAGMVKGFSSLPVISIVVPVYKTPEKVLRETIQSVRDQIYDRWELCLADDGSEHPAITRMLEEFARQDGRVRVTQLPQNGGISKATNAAAALAKGEFIALLDHDDTLSPDALYRVAELLQKHPEADLIYSDEDKLGSAGQRYDPFFKPDWSPDLLLSMNYICHFLAVRRELFASVGGLRSQFDGSQDYDLVLRVIERTRRIHHIPRVLYHWRALESSTANSPGAKPAAHATARLAIADHLDRNNIRAKAEPGVSVGRWRVRYEVVGNPKVAIIMPTGGRMDVLQPCLRGIFSITHYTNYEIWLVDNSRGPEVEEYAQEARRQWPAVQYLDYRNRPFNFSVINNCAARNVDAPLILFLNDDITVTDSEWLTAMVEHGQRPSVGAVGAKLLYPSGLIQHAGVFMGVYGNAGHAFKYLPGNSTHYFGFAQVIRNCSAVTAACLLTRRDVFLELGGFDEANLAVAFQDVDYCLRLRKAGYAVVYTPHAILIHYESVTKHEKTPNPREVGYMEETWKDAIAHDPYYSPNLSRKSEDYRIRLE